MKDIHDIIRAQQSRPNECFALATLVRTQGSSYRRPGARMLIASDLRSVGSLSGGCLEEEVAACAVEVMRSGIPKLLRFDTRRRFGCNGTIDILVERAAPTFLHELAESSLARRSFAVATSVENGSRVLRFDETPDDETFVQQVDPQIRLIIFGEGPDSAPLRAIAQTLGWEVCDCDQASDLPREYDSWTAALVKSHNYGRDYAALQTLLPLDLPYVGLVGPRARRDQLVGDLLDRGVTINAELFAPAGLDLATEGPEEIALAIISEIQRVFRAGSGESLRNSKRPIHGRQPASLAPTLQSVG